MPFTSVRMTIALLVVTIGLASRVPAQVTPQFTVSVSPSIVTITQGGMASFTVNLVVNERPSFEFRLAGLPSGVIAQFPVGHPGANTILLTALPGAATGTFNIDLTALAGNNPQTQTFILNVKPMPLEQWEYRVDTARTYQELESLAGSLGLQSWELVSVVVHEHNGAPEWIGFFKRRKRPANG